MESPPIHQNIKANLRPFLIILLAIFIFISFTVGNDVDSTEQLVSKTKPLVVGLYKSGKDEEEYFKTFKLKLETFFNGDTEPGWKIEVKSFSNLDVLCEAMNDGGVDIAGELTPIEYVVRRETCKFKPFLGIEYNNQAYYHSVLFVPQGEMRFGSIFKEQEGIDNQEILSMLVKKKNKTRLALLGQKDSTSGYYYPYGYLIRESLPFQKAKGFQTSDKIFKTVLKKGKDNRFIGGFLADFRLEKYQKKFGNETYMNEELKYAKPLIIAKSDPIPNGVFVISSKTIAEKKPGDIKKLIRIWKTLKNIEVGGPKITGWREDLERDLELVEFHKDQVDYQELLKGKYEYFLIIFIAIWILVICFVSYRFLNRI